MIFNIFTLLFITVVPSSGYYGPAGTDNIVLYGHPMEFSMQLGSDVFLFNRGINTKSIISDNSVKLRWVTRYGFIDINSLQIEYVNIGINNVGLSCDYLILSSSVHLDNVKIVNKIVIVIKDFCVWVLASFSTVDEIMRNINDVIIWNDKVFMGNWLMGLQVPIHDLGGNNIVVQFMNGKMTIFNNTY